MSIIYEALKKIEEEKKDDSSACSPIVFTLPREEAQGDKRTGVLRHAARYAALSIPLLLFLGFFIRPDLFRPSSARPSAQRGKITSPPPQPIVKEVRLQARSILPSTVDLSLKPRIAAPPVALKSQTSITDAKIPELHLKGISHSGTRSWAFINDKMLKAGDSIAGAEVVEILKDRVRLRYAGAEFTLAY